MAGILVSGGTYSGSGDVTTEFLYVMNSDNTGGNKGTIKLPNGTFEVTGENTTEYGGEGYTGFAYNLPREADLAAFDNGRGIVKISTPSNTSGYMQYVTHNNLIYRSG